ncbi:MAG TPA: rod shape-determining protein MreD [Lentimicrobium sp.]|nr:rod shape-determining protein MreD [Lentimicrobium sp.]
MNNRSYPFLFIRFAVLVAAQVLLIDHMSLGGYINPSLYILFILLLPFEVPGTLLLISSFLLGLSIDIFSNSTGLHAAASVFMAFMRPTVIRLVGAPAEYEEHLTPGIHDMGMRWFVVYSFLLVLLHQLAISILESFSFSEVGLILLRMFLSTIFTLLLIILIEYLFMNKRK